jgi:hypothetical protein
MRRIMIALGTGLALVACQTPQKIEKAFDSSAAAYIHKKGPARIEGHAFVTRFDNKVMNASGSYVYLIPATAYARERFVKLYGGRKAVPATSFASVQNDPNYAAFTRRTKAESSGRFVFENVAAGEYFVATTVTWKTSEDAIFSKGGAIYESVTVKGSSDEVVKVIVNGN